MAFRTTRPGDANRRAYVGPPGEYDFMGATQFRLLTGLGLREDHHVVDIGCGSLRAGRYLIAYLLPGRYTGIEPNAHLWQEAVDAELGQDLIRLKRPAFHDEADFSLAAVPDGSADFIVAQSIYSHTGGDLFGRSLAAVARSLAPDGIFLFTVVTPYDPAAARMPRGADTTGWVYPGCVRFGVPEVIRLGLEAGLHMEPLSWFHPRQSWFYAVRNPARRLTPDMVALLGSGKPLFDARY